MTTQNRITVEELIQSIPSGGCTIIDVREPDEVAFEAIPGAKNIPMSRIERSNLSGLSPHDRLYIICQSGGRSCRASEILRNCGFTNIIDVVGGVNAFKKAGGKLVRGKQPLPLMRQVQIAAGGLVLVGTILALTVHLAFIYLSGAVGLGLLLAGLTGACPMATLLSKMPWNRNATTSCTSDTPSSSRGGGCCG